VTVCDRGNVGLAHAAHRTFREIGSMALLWIEENAGPAERSRRGVRGGAASVVNIKQL